MAGSSSGLLPSESESFLSQNRLSISELLHGESTAVPLVDLIFRKRAKAVCGELLIFDTNQQFDTHRTLIEAWASLKSFKRKDAGPQPPPDDPGNPTVNFHREQRSNATHQ